MSTKLQSELTRLNERAVINQSAETWVLPLAGRERKTLADIDRGHQIVANKSNNI